MKYFVLRMLKPNLLFKIKPKFSAVSYCTKVEPNVQPNFCVSEAKELSHAPVMVREVLDALRPQNNGVYLDMTFGGGGHSLELLNAASIKLYCLDRDPVAYDKAKTLAEDPRYNVTPILGRFSQMKHLLNDLGVLEDSFDGILIDAGCSSMQLDDSSRGFSLSKNGPLDMRMDGNRYTDQATAADVINSLNMPDLAKIFKIYGEEKQSKKIAQAIVDSRYLLKTIRTTHELANLVFSVIGDDKRTDKLKRPAHVATKVFQALRIFVNNELNELDYGINIAHSYLKPGGRLVALTFHSLEDRIIKRNIVGIDMNDSITGTISQKYFSALTCFTQEELEKIYTNKWKSLYKRVVTPRESEIETNPRSRSAKLRVAVKQSVN